MFFTINDTKVYAFTKPSLFARLFILRTKAMTTANVLSKLLRSLAYMVFAYMVGASIVGAISDELKTVDQVLVLCALGTLSFFSSIAFMKAHQFLKYQREEIANGYRRYSYVIAKNMSFEVMITNIPEPLKPSKEVLDALLANLQIHVCDAKIRLHRFDDRVDMLKLYRQKQTMLWLIQGTYLQQDLGTSDILDYFQSQHKALNAETMEQATDTIEWLDEKRHQLSTFIKLTPAPTS